ncbi:MAG: LD-carboxypeptidase [Ignavibacteriaceae bacterium]
MRIVKPKRLKKGELIGIISPASSPNDLSRIDSGVRYLESLGYRVEVGKNVGAYHGYLAGSDKERLDDLHYMFKKKDVKAIISVRGGYGSPRLLDKIDYKIVKNNPKIFVGYSDITALQMAFLQKTGLITFAGPMLAVDFYNEVSAYTEDFFWELITSNKKHGRINLPNDEKMQQITKGTARGRIIGGNLSIFVSLLGTDFFPQVKDKIIILEEIEELPYRVDRMLNHLRLNNVFKQSAGIILGRFLDCNEHDPNKRTLTLGEVIEDYFSKINVPVIYNFKHGHIKDMVTIPFGTMVKINASRGIVEFTEAAVS